LDSNYSFLDYIQSGIEICGEIAIDFTGKIISTKKLPRLRVKITDQVV